MSSLQEFQDAPELELDYNQIDLEEDNSDQEGTRHGPIDIREPEQAKQATTGEKGIVRRATRAPPIPAAPQRTRPKNIDPEHRRVSTSQWATHPAEGVSLCEARPSFFCEGATSEILNTVDHPTPAFELRLYVGRNLILQEAQPWAGNVGPKADYNMLEECDRLTMDAIRRSGRLP